MATKPADKPEVAPGTATRSDILNETPEEKQARIDAEIAAGLRAPAPETIDQTKSTVTPAQVAGMEAAAPQPHDGIVADVPAKKGAKK